MHEVIEKLSAGILYKSGNAVDDVIENPIKFFSELLEFSRSRNRPLYIYADRAALPAIMGMWFQILFINPDVDLCKKIYDSNIQRFNLLHKSYIAKRTVNFSYKSEFEHSKLKEFLDKKISVNKNIRRQFILNNIEYIGLEYILYMWLYKGKFKEELKKSIERILRKHLDEIMIEAKMWFMVYSSNASFSKKLGLSNPLTDFDNCNITETDNRFVDFFTTSRLYSKKNITRASSSNTDFKFKEMTEYDKETLLHFIEAIGTYYNTDQSSNFISDDSYIFNFLDCVSGNFTDEMLEKMIKTESEFDNPSGIFYSIKMETVNNLLVQKILRSYKNKTLDEISGLALL